MARDPDEVYDAWVDERILAGEPWKPGQAPTPAEQAHIDQLAEEREARESDERVARAMAEDQFGVGVGAAVFELAAITMRAQSAARKAGL